MNIAECFIVDLICYKKDALFNDKLNIIFKPLTILNRVRVCLSLCLCVRVCVSMPVSMGNVVKLDPYNCRSLRD